MRRTPTQPVEPARNILQAVRQRVVHHAPQRFTPLLFLQLVLAARLDRQRGIRREELNQVAYGRVNGSWRR